MTASQKQTDCGKVISNGLFFGGEPIPGWVLADCQSPLEWILYGLCDQKNLHDAFETGLVTQAIDEDLFSLKVCRQVELEQLSKYVRKLRNSKLNRPVSAVKKSRTKQKESKLLSQIKKSLSWQYEFGEAVVLPAKQSVTQLTHRNDEYVKFDVARPAWPCFHGLEARATEPRLIGTAAHLVISQLDLSKSVTGETIEKTKEKLLADGSITENIAEHIDTQSIMAFFESDLGKTALNARSNVRREWPFTFALPTCEISSETIVVQGIIDMLIQKPEGLIIIDFKTDNITAGEVTGCAELYRRQLELYACAASAILKSKLLAKWLYFLTPGCAIEV